MNNQLTANMPVNTVKVIDRTIDIYLWVSTDMNNAEIAMLGNRLTDLAQRRAADIELLHQANRSLEDRYPTLDDLLPI